MRFLGIGSDKNTLDAATLSEKLKGLEHRANLEASNFAQQLAKALGGDVQRALFWSSNDWEDAFKEFLKRQLDQSAGELIRSKVQEAEQRATEARGTCIANVQQTSKGLNEQLNDSELDVDKYRERNLSVAELDQWQERIDGMLEKLEEIAGSIQTAKQQEGPAGAPGVSTEESAGR